MWLVVDKTSWKVVYSGEERNHAEIYRNTCAKPSDYIILNEDDKVEVKVGNLLEWFQKINDLDLWELDEMDDGIRDYLKEVLK